MSPQFLDTNVLLYAYDTGAGHRHDRAADLVLNLARAQQAAASVQVLQEFYVNAVSKIATPLTPEQAIERLGTFARWSIYSPLAPDVAAAAQLSRQHQLSFWDAMIVLSAVRLKCAVLWTEDLNAGQVIEGVTIRNPFAQ
jgi:predicted nucleic acid-binding protein